MVEMSKIGRASSAAFLVLAALGLASTATYASTVNFNFSTAQADAASYQFTDVATGLVLTVTPATFLGAAITNQGSVTETGAGLGVLSPADGQPLVDAAGLNDLAVFSFSAPVTLSSLTLNNTDPHDSFRFFHDSDNNGSLVDFGLYNGVNHPSGLVALGTLFPGYVTGKLFGFGALLDPSCHSCNNNEWRIGGLSVAYTAPVPLPAAFPLFGGAVAGVALIGRWRKRRVA